MSVTSHRSTSPRSNNNTPRRSGDKTPRSVCSDPINDEIIKLFSLCTMPSRAQLFLDVKTAPERLVERIASIGGSTFVMPNVSAAASPSCRFLVSSRRSNIVRRLRDMIFPREKKAGQETQSENRDGSSIEETETAGLEDMKYISEHDDPLDAWSEYFNLVVKKYNTLIFDQKTAIAPLSLAFATCKSPLSFSTNVLHDVLTKLWKEGWDDVTEFDADDEKQQQQQISNSEQRETKGFGIASVLRYLLLKSHTITTNKGDTRPNGDMRPNGGTREQQVLLVHWPSIEAILAKLYNIIEEGKENSEILGREKLRNLLVDQTALSVNDFLIPITDIRNWTMRKLTETGVVDIKKLTVESQQNHWKALKRRLLAEVSKFRLIQVNDLSQCDKNAKLQAVLISLDGWFDDLKSREQLEANIRMCEAVLSETILFDRLSMQSRHYKLERDRCTALITSYLNKGSRHLAQITIKKKKLLEEQIAETESHMNRLLEVQSARNRSTALRVVAGVVENVANIYNLSR